MEGTAGQSAPGPALSLPGQMSDLSLTQPLFPHVAVAGVITWS